MSSVDFTSIVDCRNTYIDYYYKGNKLDTDKDDIAEIEELYEDYLNKWKTIGRGVDDDTNAYVIDDDSWDKGVEEGKETATEETGYESTGARKAGRWIYTGTNAALSAGAAVCTWAVTAASTGKVAGGVVGGIAEKATSLASQKASKMITEEAIRKAGEKAVEKASEEAIKKAGEESIKKTAEEAAKELGEEAAKKAGEEAVEKASEEAIKKAGEESIKQTAEESTKNENSKGNCAWIVTIPIELASAIMAIASNANGKAADALTELSDVLTEQQEEVVNAEVEMEDAAIEVAEADKEVTKLNDTNNKKMITLQTKTNGFYNAYKTLEAKGEGRTTDENKLMEILFAKINKNNEEQNNINEKTSAAIVDTTSEIAGYQEVYDGATEVMANTQGMTDYGASFDEATKALCIVTMVSDALNVASAAKDGISALSCPILWISLPYVALAAAAVTMSTIDGLRQIKYLNVANNEIGIRETTEQLNEGAAGTYDTDITEYDGSLQAVGELTPLELKQKTVTLTTTTTSTNNNSSSSNSSNSGKTKNTSETNKSSNSDSKTNNKKKV